MKSSKELREQIGEVLAKCESLNELAQSEDRDLSTDEQKQFDSWINEIGHDGSNDQPKSGLYASVEQREKFERLVADKSKPAAEVKQEAKKEYAKPKGRPMRAFRDHQEAYDAGVWFKAAIMKDPDAIQSAKDKGIYNIQKGGTDNVGGYTVPSTVSDAILNFRNTVGVAPQVCRVVPMTSDVMNIPKGTGTGPTVYYPGEASAITLSDKTYGTIALTAVKRATLTQISNELLKDSILPSIMDDLAMDAGHALAYAMDNEFINGDASSTYGGETGLITACGAAGTEALTTTNDSWADATLANLNSVMARVASKYWNEANMAWIVRRQMYSAVISKLLYAAGGNTVDTIAGVQRPSLFGYPIYFTDNMPADAASTFVAFFGNFRDAAAIGERDGVMMATSTEYGFNLDVLTLRLTSRYDINVHNNPGASVAYGAYAGLKTGATS